ncbi:Arginine deiminase [Slackia heliotrinireducens]|uniref:Arginine deiminase n=1 Tax=Slackia heliotrinireducens (strain ATCC 29202 / DSM 20476 / NCTC 11029 / RHS 1) TaxID=471855 RepID=C7N4L7_SLAHD|nr:arginine deiminase family protein [Slackia heliotrinireducens]ACV21852.1 arginine deiminase [Slackia heliotrinireducens DSM 20476]VEG99601.1 Arginine deiminase [Slackia heliotrinireducens]
MINVYSEIGPLRRVLMHRPGNEIMQLYPYMLGEMLFEDTPFLPAAQAEHDAYTAILRNAGVEVVYLRDLFAQAMNVPEARAAFTREFASASRVPSRELEDRVVAHYDSLSVEDLVEAVFCGIRKNDPAFADVQTLGGMARKEDVFLVNPMPNCYFTRDSSVNVADSVILSHMTKEFRRREPILLKYVHTYSDLFRDDPTQDLYNMDEPYGIEGGDVIVLSDKAVAIGCSERTDPGAVEHVAKSLFAKGYEAVYAFDIGRDRFAMHLDGMLTMIGYDTFIYNPLIEGKVSVFKLTPAANDGITTVAASDDWSQVLAEALHVPAVKLIPCGGDGDDVRSLWEMWNMGSNVLTIRPGEVVGYDRAVVTLDLLDKAGITVHTFTGAELSRGRGGARCMSMPLVRDAI